MSEYTLPDWEFERRGRMSHAERLEEQQDREQERERRPQRAGDALYARRLDEGFALLEEDDE